MAWRQLVLKPGANDPELIEALLLELGALSVTFTDGADNPVLEPGPGETPLWADTLVTGLFAGDTDLDALINALRDQLGTDALNGHRIEELEDRVWEREWLHDVDAMRFGQRLWIQPGENRIAARDAVVVRLDPGLAFGTGTHATTALCLEWLDGLNLRGQSLLDYGCGSGVLAIAALKLGCRTATAYDIDPQALLATQRNARRNDVDDRLRVIGPDDDLGGQYENVVANILAGPLVEFAESITAKLANEGMLTLSGVLCEQAPQVMAAYAPWIAFGNPEFRAQDGQVWARLTGRRKTG